MPRAKSPARRIVSYFMQAPLEEASALLDTAKAIIANRQPVKRTRAPRKAKVAATEPAAATPTRERRPKPPAKVTESKAPLLPPPPPARVGD